MRLGPGRRSRRLPARRRARTDRPHLRVQLRPCRSFEIVCADGDLRDVTAEAGAGSVLGAARRQGRLRSASPRPRWNCSNCRRSTAAASTTPAAEIPALLRAYQQFVSSAVPESLTTSLAILRLPDLPVLPPPLRGQTVAQLRVGYVGSGDGAAAEAELLLAPLRAAVAKPFLGAVGELPYADIGTIHNDPTVPSAHATAGILLRDFESATAEALLAVAGPEVSTPLAIVEIRHFGGAIARAASPPMRSAAGTPASASGFPARRCRRISTRTTMAATAPRGPRRARRGRPVVHRCCADQLLRLGKHRRRGRPCLAGRGRRAVGRHPAALRPGRTLPVRAGQQSQPRRQLEPLRLLATARAVSGAR